MSTGRTTGQRQLSTAEEVHSLRKHYCEPLSLIVQCVRVHGIRRITETGVEVLTAGTKSDL
jgi:hypothetical protein